MQGPHKVLIIEDNELLSKVYVTALEEEGFEVLQARDGEEGLNKAVLGNPDVILLDLLLPGMNGFEVLKSLRMSPRTQQIPVIVLSNIGHEEKVQRALSLGAVDYLIKTRSPISTVIGTIRRHLSSAPVGERRMQYRLRIAPGVDASALAEDLDLTELRCPTCNEELLLYLWPQGSSEGRFTATIGCPVCNPPSNSEG